MGHGASSHALSAKRGAVVSDFIAHHHPLLTRNAYFQPAADGSASGPSPKTNTSSSTSSDSAIRSILLSIRHHTAELAAMIMDAAAVATFAGSFGVTNLMLAASVGGGQVEETIESLARLGQDVLARELERRDRWGTSALHMAAHTGQARAAAALVAAGADMNAADAAGWTPLAMAVAEKHLDMCALLLDAGAAIETKNNVGETPLLIACRANQPKIVELLLAKGANPTVKSWDTALLKPGLGIAALCRDRGFGRLEGLVNLRLAELKHEEAKQKHARARAELRKMRSISKVLALATKVSTVKTVETVKAVVSLLSPKSVRSPSSSTTTTTTEDMDKDKDVDKEEKKKKVRAFFPSVESYSPKAKAKAKPKPKPKASEADFAAGSPRAKGDWWPPPSPSRNTATAAAGPVDRRATSPFLTEEENASSAWAPQLSLPAGATTAAFPPPSPKAKRVDFQLEAKRLSVYRSQSESGKKRKLEMAQRLRESTACTEKMAH